MDGTFAFICRRESVLSMQEIYATHRTNPARARWGKSADELPTPQSLFLEELHPSGPVQESIDQFVAARQLAGHSIAVSSWVRKM